MSEPIVRRPAMRTCWCRGCDTRIEKGTEIIYTYSHLNRGQNIIFCLPCARDIGNLASFPVEGGGCG